jgi:hypothetical protein
MNILKQCKVESVNYLDVHLLPVPKCSICGMTFRHEQELKEHGIAVHNFSEEESLLLRKAGQEEKARKRSRGPYRKSHAA